jgi:hypothetical protein
VSLLSICQEVAAEIPMAAPTSIVGNPDGIAQLMLALAQRAGEALARRPPGGWVALIREYGFATAALAPQAGTLTNSGAGGVAVISGLSGLAAVAANSWYAFGTGLKSNSIVAAVNAGAGTATLNQPAAQTGAGQFSFGQSDYPLPADFQRPLDNTMWDRARLAAMRGPQSPPQWQIYKSSVLGRAAIARRFRFRNASGQAVLSIDPVPTDNGAALVFEYVSNAWCRSSGGAAQSAWLADSDVAVLDEYLIKLGLRWRVLRRLGMSYADELDEYERAAAKALAHDGGAAVLDLALADRLALVGPWNVPEGNFGSAGGG